MVHFKALLCLVFSMVIFTSAEANDRPRLSLPLNCTVGEDCWFQNLMDMDEGPARRDPFCGGSTYNGHKGTDIRVGRLADMKRNVEALAMAPGKVLALRNNMPDRLVEGEEQSALVKGKECGNGALVSHGKGWTTQYCHLAKGSVVVKKGQVIKRGDPIGTVGLSGFTTFPHVHVTVRKGKTIIDPMTGRAQGEACSVEKVLGADTLWSDGARGQIPDDFTQVLEAGFTSAKIGKSDVLKGKVVPVKQSGPLLFYAHFINLRKGDEVEILVEGPGGVFVKHREKPLKVDKASWTSLAGKRGSPASGRYVGSATVFRDGKAVLKKAGVSISF